MLIDYRSPVRLHHVLDGRPRLEGGTLWGPDAEGPDPDPNPDPDPTPIFLLLCGCWTNGQAN